MLAGFGGHLVGEAFLEERLRTEAIGPAPAAVARAFRDAVAAVGPASSSRALLHAASTPILSVLGFAAPDNVTAG